MASTTPPSSTSPSAPLRIVSLLPSATEMLALLGVHVVGRSHECDFPISIRDSCPALTGAHNKFESSGQMHDAVTASMQSGKGLYFLDTETLQRLQPDVIVTQSLCSVCAVDLSIVQRAAAALDPPPRIVDTNPMSLQGVIDDVRRLGAELGAREAGEAVAAALTARVERAAALAEELAATAAATAAAAGEGEVKKKVVVFLEWTVPLFPGGHWTPQLIHMAGGLCPINPPKPGGGALPSKQVDPAEVVAADPDLIIVAPCGLDLETTRREVDVLADESWWRGLRAVQSGAVVLADGNQHFNRPGPRLVEALEWLVGLLAGRPDLMPQDFPWEWLGALPPLAATAAAAEEKEGETAEGSGRVESGVTVTTKPGNGSDQASLRLQELSTSAGATQLEVTTAAAGVACCGGGVPRHDEPALDPWVAAGSQWSVTPHLPVDIEELHEATCSKGGATYDDPQTGFTVFTSVSLAKRKYCCANRCRHCPWGHFKVQGPRPRLNRITRPMLLQPSPGTRRVSTAGPAAAAAAAAADAGQQGPRRRWSGALGGALTSGGDGGGIGGSGGVTLVCYEGDVASEAVVRVLAAAARAGAKGGAAPQRVVLLAAFDVDSGDLWGSATRCSGGSGGGRASGGGGAEAGLEGGSTGDIGAAMDSSLRHDLDLVAVPLQVSGRSWQRDPAVAAEVLAYVVRTAAQLMQEREVAAVVAARPEDGTPRLFARGTEGAVAGGWAEVVRRANAALQQQQPREQQR